AQAGRLVDLKGVVASLDAHLGGGAGDEGGAGSDLQAVLLGGLGGGVGEGNGWWPLMVRGIGGTCGETRATPGGTPTCARTEHTAAAVPKIGRYAPPCH